MLLDAAASAPARTLTDTLWSAYSVAQHLGLGLILWHIFSAVITSAFRPRTDAELAAMALARPYRYKLLMLCKAGGFDKPEVWKWAGSLLFARALTMHREDTKDIAAPPDPDAESTRIRVDVEPPAVPPEPPAS